MSCLSIFLLILHVDLSVVLLQDMAIWYIYIRMYYVFSLNLYELWTLVANCWHFYDDCSSDPSRKQYAMSTCKFWNSQMSRKVLVRLRLYSLCFSLRREWTIQYMWILFPLWQLWKDQSHLGLLGHLVVKPNRL